MLVKSNFKNTKQSIKAISLKFWENLSYGKKKSLKTTWGILSYKWQWQIALNMPFLIIWAMDRSIPAVHEFDMKVLSSIAIPEVLSTWVGSFL